MEPTSHHQPSHVEHTILPVAKPGDIVHYTDHAGLRHAAKVEHVSGSTANLHILHAHGDVHNRHEYSVPLSATPAPHTWTHLPK